MGYDLINAHQEKIWASTVGWYKLLDLAKLGGWVPAGTVQLGYHHKFGPGDGKWDGNYVCNSGQWVTVGDSFAMADAIQGMLDDIPESHIPDQKIDIYSDTQLGSLCPPSVRESIEYLREKYGGYPGASESELQATGLDNFNLGALDFFGGSNKELLPGFIRYCRRGGFQIW